MTATRFGRMQKATTIVPLALLSVAWTATLAGVVPTSTVASPLVADGALPDGTSVPTEAIEAPASVSAPARVDGGVTGNADQIVASSSTNGIPSSALTAYQRAETVINAADKSCNLTWQLVAAIGRVESNHGRFGGNVLDDEGVAQPGIRGIALDGSNDTAVIRDTDAGQYDQDTVYDRAVGPMQFIPSTWSVVGVDADNDGERNPQDIDDAALGTAVYLCSGDDDLSTIGGQRSAVYRYNHSSSYVDLVISIMENYLEGDFMTVPDGTRAAGTVSPLPPSEGPRGNGPRLPGGPGGAGGAGGGNGAGGDAPDTEVAPTQPSEPSQPSQPDQPSTPITPPTGGGGGGGNGGGGNDGPKLPVPPVQVPDVPDTGIPPVDDGLSRVKAIAQCALDGIVVNSILIPGNELEECIDGYMNP